MANSRFDYHKREELDLDQKFEPGFFIIIRLERDQSITGHGSGNPILDHVQAASDIVTRNYPMEFATTNCLPHEVSFVIKPKSNIHSRRKSKIISMISVIFSTAYKSISNHDQFWTVRANEYANEKLVNDYMTWRQSISKCSAEEDEKKLFFSLYEAELDQKFCQRSYIIVRVDGHKFHQLSSMHKFKKPNDKRALDLMVHSAKLIIEFYKGDIALAYGDSDEFSFMIRSNSKLISRSVDRLLSEIPMRFAAFYNDHWLEFMSPEVELKSIAWFDAKARKYPNFMTVIDYFRWRQADCHINNLYNTTLHALTGAYTRYELVDPARSDREVRTSSIRDWAPGGHQFLTSKEATVRLENTFSSDKQEILFQLGINYNKELEQFKKGTILIGGTQATEKLEWKNIRQYSVDIIKDKQFWLDNSHIFDDFDISLL